MKSTNSIYLLTLKKSFIENRKNLTLGVLGFFAMCLLMGGWTGAYGYGGGDAEIFIYLTISILLAQIVASLTFSDFKTKEGRIAQLMYPAPVFAKVLPRLLAPVLGIVVVIIIGFYFLEGGRYLANGLFNGVWSEFANPWYLLSVSNVEESISVAALIGLWFMSQSYFIIGSVLWPKYSYLKAIAVLWVIEILFFAFAGIVFKWIGGYSIMVIDYKPIAVSITILMYLLGFAMLYGAYHRVKTITVKF